MILLLHLSTCAQWDEEARLSRNLIDQVFDLRRNRILSGTIVPLGAKMGNIRTHLNSNPRYSTLNILRTRVWQKFGWPISDAYGQRELSSEMETVETGRQCESGPNDFSVSDAWNAFSADPPSNVSDLEWEDWTSFLASPPMGSSV